MTSLPVFLRPSVRYTEIDLTQRVNVILSTTAAVVGEFDRGPLEPTYMTGNAEDFGTVYGRVANPQLSYAHDTVTTFKTQSANALIVRAVKDALYSGATVFIDRTRHRVLGLPFAAGTTGNYLASGLVDFYLIDVPGVLVSGDTIDLILTDGTRTQPVSVDFTTDHTTTLREFAIALQSAVDVFGLGGSVAVVFEPVGDSHLVAVRMPRNALVQIVDAELANGSTAKTILVSDKARLFDAFAENPGAWSADQYGMQLASFDAGTRERYRIALSKALAAGNTFTATLNGRAIGPVAYATDSDTTMQAIATAIAAHPDVHSAVVTAVAGAVNNDREILIIAKRPGPGKLAFKDARVNGSSPAAVATTTTLTGIESDESFNFNIYNRDNVARPVDQFTVTLRSGQNSLGNQTNVEYLVNTGSRKSINVRVAQEAYTRESSFSLLNDAGDAPTAPETICWLAGGANGVKCSSAEIRQGWDKIEDRTQYPVSLLLNAGYTAKSVQKHIDALAQRRGDCMGILDAPSEFQAPAQALREYRLNELDIDSNYSAMYSPDVEIEDYYTGERRFIPPSGPIGATYCYSDRLTNGLGAPAGLNRGQVRVAVGLRVKYSAGDEELLHPIGINCIIDKKLTGPTVMGEETLQVKKTVLSSVHARRVLNIIKVGLTDGLEFTLFDPNSEFTRFTATQLGYTIINPLIPGGLIAGLIKCDDENNPPEVIDNDTLAYFVYLKIQRVIKGIDLRAYLTRTGIRFEEVIAAS